MDINFVCRHSKDIADFIKDSFSLECTQYSMFVDEVHDKHLRKLGLDNHFRSYSMWVISGYTCVHVVCCITASDLDINEYIKDYFKFYAYRSTYSYDVYQVPKKYIFNVLSSKPLIKPSSYKHPPDRP